jgi:hypothetical protein
MRQRAPFSTNAHILEVIFAMIPERPELDLLPNLPSGLLLAH